MGLDTDKLSPGALDLGINVRDPEFTTALQLDKETFNVTAGIQQGLGPRYGMAPLPYHSETIGFLFPPHLAGFKESEGSLAYPHLHDRQKFHALISLILKSKASPKLDSFGYITILTAGYSAVIYHDVNILSYDTGSAPIYSWAPTLKAGPTASFVERVAATASPYLMLTSVKPSADAGATKVQGVKNLLAVDTSAVTTQYLSYVLASVTGQDYASRYKLGRRVSGGDATHAPNVNFNLATSNDAAIDNLNLGVSSDFQLSEHKSTKRNIMASALLADGSATHFVRHADFLTTYFAQALDKNSTASNISFASQAGVTIAGAASASHVMVYVEDADSLVNSTYKAVLVATGAKAFAYIIQEWNRGVDGMTGELFDLTQNPYEPDSINTTNPTNTQYKENTVPVASCFREWPGYSSTAAMVSDGTDVNLKAANTGVLRANTDYEITYSIFNKRLGFETNVGKPVRVRTGASDFVAIEICEDRVGGTNLYNLNVAGRSVMPITPFQPQNSLEMNYCEYRIYYRLLGTAEWLPALFMDCARYWAGSDIFDVNICERAISGSVGGYPGGFNDYSSLPKDQWKCAIFWKNRAWWFSSKQCVFSLRNNIFAYPLRNSVSSPGGAFRGGIVHNYPGQADQSSRLIIFTDVGTYVARFSGDPVQVPVQVSPDATGTFDLDGSDLVVDAWTSNTAFSHRAAVVAEGLLYFWGETGIFLDTGSETPTRISIPLEPDLFSLYDSSKTNEIFSLFNSKTKEIFWFYRPKNADGYKTHALIYNVETEQWLKAKFKVSIESGQEVKIDENIGTGGSRLILNVSDDDFRTFQRPYFFDELCRSGDENSKCDYVISDVAAGPAADQRVLTLSGAAYNAAALATIAVGDYLAFNQLTKYSSIVATDDFIARIDAIDTVLQKFTVTLPSGVTLPVTSLSTGENFPVWHKAASGDGLHGIPWQLKTKYWMAKGVNYWAMWLYTYFLAKVRLWPAALDAIFDLGYRTPVSAALRTDNMTWMDNSDGSAQIYHPMGIGDMNIEGQAVKYLLSGSHIGHEWVLQYLEAHAQEQPGDNLKIFEG